MNRVRNFVHGDITKKDDGWVIYGITSPDVGDREGIYYSFEDAFKHKKEPSDIIVRYRATHTYDNEYMSEGLWEKVN